MVARCYSDEKWLDSAINTFFPRPFDDELPIRFPIFVTELGAPDRTERHTAMGLTWANGTP